MNRAASDAKPKLNRIFLYHCGVLIFLHLMLVSDYGDATLAHSAIYYRVAALGTPTMLVAYARASGRRYGATIIASIYMAITAAALWILPLFPAHPRLGPVYTNVTHMVPMSFPILLAAGALGLDLVLNRLPQRSRWLRAALAATAYIAFLLLVSWPWGTFMMTSGRPQLVLRPELFPISISAVAALPGLAIPALRNNARAIRDGLRLRVDRRRGFRLRRNSLRRLARASSQVIAP